MSNKTINQLKGLTCRITGTSRMVFRWLLSLNSRRISILVICGLLSACASSLPRNEKITGSPWKTFDEAKTAYEQIQPRQTTLADLREFGFDPYSSPNIEILNYLEVIHRFLPNDSLQLSDLDENVRGCIEARHLCFAYEAKPANIVKQRTGNFFSDVLNFHRTTIKTGWYFTSLILIHENVVVYKLWSGTPVVDEASSSSNPLGPLQRSSDLVRDVVMP